MTVTSPKTAVWLLVDSEELHAADNMEMDRSALEQMNRGLLTDPLLRFFEWLEPCVTYGTLLDEEKARAWAAPQFQAAAGPVVRRPTGGGAVYHQRADLSISLLWPRFQGLLPERPRACYEHIHTFLKAGLDRLTNETSDLYVRSFGSCQEESLSENKAGRFSACFEEPVCNDVMQSGKKIVGGALRFMKKAALYQGAILLEKSADKTLLKEHLVNLFPHHFNGASLSPYS